MNNILSENILEINSLNKRYKNIHAVKDISFSLEQGDVFAFLGPNGAGKTTTLRMLLDIIRPDSGTIKWNLKGNVSSVPPSENIGYLPEERGLYTDVPIINSLVYMAAIRGMDQAIAKKAAMEWLEKFELANRAKEKLQALSKGNQQKIQFIASIIHKPAFAILDEPFSGLDPINQEKFIDYIRDLNLQGTTILLSSHQMPLVEKIAKKVFLINQGQKLFCGTLSELYKDFEKRQILNISFNSNVNEERLRLLPEVENINWVNPMEVKITFKVGVNLNNALSELIKMDSINNISSHNPDLHDIFLNLVKNHKL
ncbi:MAG TPA: ATP-binding cassette domain-containing protein [Ignavibacteriaceae bacterium]|nr:ATP-binding cassette domain-containing protein [Ignavibacteriaceae bacterium]